MNHSQYHGSNSLVYNNYHILILLIKVVTEANVYMYPTTSLGLCDSTTSLCCHGNYHYFRNNLIKIPTDMFFYPEQLVYKLGVDHSCIFWSNIYVWSLLICSEMFQSHPFLSSHYQKLAIIWIPHLSIKPILIKQGPNK